MILLHKGDTKKALQMQSFLNIFAYVVPKGRDDFAPINIGNLLKFK